MSRAIIGGTLALLVILLTAAAFFVTSSRLEAGIEHDVDVRVQKAQELLIQNAKLEQLSLLKRVEDLSRAETLLSALKAETTDVAAERAGFAFQAFRGKDSGATPDVLALLDKRGLLVALELQGEASSITNDAAWKDGDRLKYRGIELALDPKNPQMVSDIWNLAGQGLMKVGVAPVVDYSADATDPGKDGTTDTTDVSAGRTVQGVVVVAYTLSAAESQRQSGLLGAEVAFFTGTSVAATSFRRGNTRQEDTGKHAELGKLLAGGLSAAALDSQSGLADPVEVNIDGERYLAAAGRMVRFSSKGFPDDYGKQTVGAAVLISLDDAMEPVGAARMGILIVGIGAFIIGLLALWFVQHRVVHQIDQIENGLAEIINGNLEYYFQPVGEELDGIGNNLNVMLARLLGRPEPGEEEYDEHGNMVHAGRLDFDTEMTAEDRVKNEQAVSLAQEDEPDYYKRLFGEYVSARDSVGQGTDGVTFDSFVTKLRVNESSLKDKYQCSAIRFKVVVKDGSVTLKPVPIV